MLKHELASQGYRRNKDAGGPPKLAAGTRLALGGQQGGMGTTLSPCGALLEIKKRGFIALTCQGEVLEIGGLELPLCV